MSLPFEIEKKRGEIEREVESEGAELVEIQFRHTGGRSVIALIVDKRGGVTLDECVRINQRVSRWLDDLSVLYEGETGDFIRGAYLLEVSSPGLDRPLKTEKDFKRAEGQTVKLTWRQADGRVVTAVGQVGAAGEGRVSIRFSDSIGTMDVPLESIVKAVREIRFKRT